MTEFIVRLEKEQIRQERRKLLSDDVYVLAHDVLKQAHKDGLTSLTQVELYLSGKRLAHVLLSLPNVEEGIEDELEELEEMEAGSEDEAVIVGMIAAAIINANGSSRNRDITPIVLPIFRRWGGHRLCIPILEAMQIKEEKRWMEGKRTNLLSCTLEETTREGEEEVEDLLQNFLDDCDMWEPTTFKDFFLTLSKYNADHENRYQSHIDALKEKLRARTSPQPPLHIEKQINNSCQQLQGPINQPTFLTRRENEQPSD